MTATRAEVAAIRITAFQAEEVSYGMSADAAERKPVWGWVEWHGPVTLKRREATLHVIDIDGALRSATASRDWWRDREMTSRTGAGNPYRSGLRSIQLLADKLAAVTKQTAVADRS